MLSPQLSKFAPAATALGLPPATRMDAASESSEQHSQLTSTRDRSLLVSRSSQSIVQCTALTHRRRQRREQHNTQRTVLCWLFNHGRASTRHSSMQLALSAASATG